MTNDGVFDAALYDCTCANYLGGSITCGGRSGQKTMFFPCLSEKAQEESTNQCRSFDHSIQPPLDQMYHKMHQRYKVVTRSIERRSTNRCRPTKLDQP